MRLTGYEIKKLMTQIPLWIAFIGLFVGNLFLLFMIQKKEAAYVYVYQQKDQYIAFCEGNEQADELGFYEADLEEQKRYLDSYREFISQMQDRSKAMENVISEGNHYLTDNIRKTCHDFSAVAKASVTVDNCFGIKALAEYQYGIFFAISFQGVLTWYLLFYERNRKLFILIKGCKNGHHVTAYSKLFLLLSGGVLYTLLQETSVVLFLKWMYGYGNMNRHVQSVSLFRNCPYVLSVGQAIGLLIFLRVGLSLLTGSVLFMAGMLVKSETGAFIVMMLPMICEYAAYHFIAVTGTLRVCKIINPFFYWDMRQALGSYVNFNFGGHAIGKNEVAVSVFLIIYVVCCASGINLFHRTCQISDSDRLETLIIRLRKKWSVLGHRRNLVYYEFYKLLIQQKKGMVIIIALWLMMQNVFAVYAPQYYATAKDAAYHMYLKNLSGQLTEETLEQVENEKRRLEQLQESSRESAEMSGTDEIDRLLMQLEWQRLHEGFQELTDQIRGLSEKEGKLSEKYLLDEKAYLDIWGNVTHEVLTWYVGAVLLLFLLGGIYGAGEESNLIPLIRSTRRGREVLERSKDLAAIICVVFVYLVMAAPLFLKLQNIDGFATAGQKMCNLVNWNCESSITLGWYETFVFVLKFGSFLAVGILGRTLYKKLKQRIPALLMGSGILIIVVLLLLYFKRSSHMILLNMI